MSYAPHAALTDPARAASSLWRLSLGLVLAIGVMLTLSRMVFALMRWAMEDGAFRALMAEVETGSSPAGLLILLATMGAMGVGTVVAAIVAHNRAPGTLFGPRAVFVRQFLRVLLALALLYALVWALPPWPKIPGLQEGLPPGLWLSLLPLTLAALLVQVGSEELLFRGYLQSQLAARFRHPAIWLTVPSALFAMGHYAPEIYGGNALWVSLWAFAFGLAAADLTARSGSLGPAIALHLANNVMAIALVALAGDLSGLGLFLLPFGTGDEAALRALLPVDLAAIFVGWLAARLALRV